MRGRTTHNLAYVMKAIVTFYSFHRPVGGLAVVRAREVDVFKGLPEGF